MKKTTSHQPFDKLSQFYDVLYKNKKYKKEAKIIDAIVHKYVQTKPFSILDVGCGTGEYAKQFCQLGYQVTGIDKSGSMIRIARKKKYQTDTPPKFFRRDARNFRLHRKFPIVVSLFHVLSYQLTNKDVDSFLSNINRHTSLGGIFVFDMWYGPGVLLDKPQKKYKTIKTSQVTLQRWKDPILHIHTNTVDVNQQFSISTNTNSKEITFHETHSMRYFFFREIELFLSRAGFKIIEWGSLAHTLHPSQKPSWDAWFVAKKTNYPLSR